MRVLIIDTVPFELNGISTMIMSYYKYFPQNEISCDFIINTTIDQKYMDYIHSRNDKVIILKDRNKRPWRYISMLNNVVRDTNYDIVYIHGNSATMAIDLLGVQNSSGIKIVHGHGVNTQHPIINFILSPIFKKLYNVGFAASEEAGKWLYGRRANFKIINNGIETVRFKFNSKYRHEIREKYHLNGKTFIQVGMFNKQKNQNFSLEFFNKYLSFDSQAKLIFLGEGQNLVKMNQKAKLLGISDHVLFLGAVHHTERFYSAADIALFPSNFEPFGIVALEAQTSGLPIIVSDKVIDKLKLSTYFFKFPLNIDKWIDTSKKLIIGTRDKNGYELVKNAGYDIETDSKKLFDYFQSLLKNSI